MRDKVTGQVCSTGDRDLDGTIFIKNLEICNFSITMIFGNLIVLSSCCTKAAISGVAFYDGSVQISNQLLYQFWTQIIAGWRFTG